MLRNYPEQAQHPCPVCASTDWAITPPPGVDMFEVKNEIERERRERLQEEEKRHRKWVFFWGRRHG